MTQTLDLDAQIARADRSRATVEPTFSEPASAATASASKIGTFAITFGIAFAVLYTVLEQLNWPLFTYHPAVGKLDFGMQPARRGEGPPMYWYGWLALSFGGALVLGALATMVSSRWLQRATVFCCALAALWPALVALAVFTADRVSFDAEFLKSPWIWAAPAGAGAAAVSYLVSNQWAQRAWIGLLLIMPVGGLVVLGYSLKPWFLR